MILPDSVADNLNHCEHIQFATALQSMNEYILHDPTVLQECGCARQTSLPGGLPVNTSQHMDTYMGELACYDAILLFPKKETFCVSLYAWGASKS